MTETPFPWPALAAAATGILVGAALVATRSIASEIPPGSLALLRYVIGCLCLAPAFLMRRRVRVSRRDAGAIGIIGVLQFAVVVGLLNLSLQRIASARAALLFSVCPVLTLALEALLRRSWPSLSRTGGVALALAGVGIAFGWEALREGAGVSWAGEGAALLSALVAAGCSISYRPYLAKYGALSVGLYALPPAVASLAVVAGFEGLFARPLRLEASGWLAAAFIGISSAAGYLLWLWALKHRSPTRVTVFLTLNPISAALFGALYLGERVGPAFGIGLTCVITGVWLAYRSPGGSLRRV